MRWYAADVFDDGVLEVLERADDLVHASRCLEVALEDLLVGRLPPGLRLHLYGQRVGDERLLLYLAVQDVYVGRHMQDEVCHSGLHALGL